MLVLVWAYFFPIRLTLYQNHLMFLYSLQLKIAISYDSQLIIMYLNNKMNTVILDK